MRVELKEAARGRWGGILPQLGVPAHALTGKHAPCPMCGGKDRFRFDNRDGRGTFICSGCGDTGQPAAGDGIKLVMMLKHVDFKGARELIEPLIEMVPAKAVAQERTAPQKMASIKRVWSNAVPIDPHDAVGTYLRSRCGNLVFPDVLRFASDLPYRHEDGRLTYHPAMVAKLQDRDGKGVNVHRTYLTDDGQKIDFGDPRRMMEGNIPDGSAVRLAPAAETMGVAEGIENALSASKLFQVPCWSTINYTMLTKWLPPEGVKKVIVFGDNDASYTGQMASFTLARKLVTKGICDAEVMIPHGVGNDWNDVHLQEGT